MIENLEGEIWKDIEGYEGLYAVSNMGRIMSIEKKRIVGHGTQIRTYPTMIRSQVIMKDGYHQIRLFRNDKPKNFLVHRIVAETFIPNPENKPEVNHKFGNKSDNRVSELEWATASENGKHAFRIGLKKQKKLGDNPSAKIVLDLQTGIFYTSAKEAAMSKGIRYQLFSDKMCNRSNNNLLMVYV